MLSGIVFVNHNGLNGGAALNHYGLLTLYNHVRLPQGLAPHRYPLRQMPDRILSRRRPRNHCYLLAAIDKS